MMALSSTSVRLLEADTSVVALASELTNMKDFHIWKIMTELLNELFTLVFVNISKINLNHFIGIMP